MCVGELDGEGVSYGPEHCSKCTLDGLVALPIPAFLCLQALPVPSLPVGLSFLEVVKEATHKCLHVFVTPLLGRFSVVGTASTSGGTGGVDRLGSREPAAGSSSAAPCGARFVLWPALERAQGTLTFMRSLKGLCIL